MRAAAAAWRSELRGFELLARHGGEEFALVAGLGTSTEAYEVVERVRSATPGGMTCSAGLVAWDGNEGELGLVGRADRALYAAKAAGRDRVLIG